MSNVWQYSLWLLDGSIEPKYLGNYLDSARVKFYWFKVDLNSQEYIIEWRFSDFEQFKILISKMYPHIVLPSIGPKILGD